MDFRKIKKKKLMFVCIGAALVLLAFSLYLFPIRTAHWWDETVYLQNAETIFFHATNYNELSFRPPLISIIYGLGFLIWHSTIFASILTAAINALAPIFVFLIGKKIYGEKTGVVAALLIGFSPFVIRNANYLLTDVPVISLMAISVYFALSREKKWTLFFSGVFLGLAILMKFSAVLLVPIMIFYLLINKSKWKDMLFAGLGVLAVMVPYLIWAQISFGSFLKPFIKGAAMVSGAPVIWSFYLTNFHQAFTEIAIAGLALWAIFSVAKRKISKNEIIFLSWIALFSIYLTVTPHKELRYILPIAIPVVLLSASGIVSLYEKIRLNKKYKKIFAISLIIIFLAIIVFHTNAWGKAKNGTFVNRTITNEMEIADYLNSINYSGAIYTNQRWPVFAYYTKQNITSVFSYNGTIEKAIEEDMKSPGIVIGMYNQSDLYFHAFDKSWMDQDKRFTYFKSFGEFYIYNYTPSNSTS